MNLKESKILVTVIVPTIGRPEYITHTIQSILNQTYANIQILISDNSPPIPTDLILKEAGISDSRIEIISRLTRMNYCDHMNACIRDARGKYLMILSDDDQISSGYVKEMVDMAESAENVRVCVGRQQVIGGDTQGLVPSQLSQSPQLIISGSKYLKNFISGIVPEEVFTHISVFARKSDIIEAGGLREYPYGAHSDSFLVIRLAMLGNVAFSKNLMFYRIYLGSVGLSMPFNALLDATKKYSSDIYRLINEINDLSLKQKKQLIRSMQISNGHLLVYRLRHIYAKRISIREILANLIKISFYWIMPPR